MGRREQRVELQSTWHVYEPVRPGVPITRADRDEARTREEIEAQRIEQERASRPKSMRGLAARQRAK